MSCDTRIARIVRRCVVTAVLTALLCACSVPSSLPRITTFTAVRGSADTALPKRLVLSASSSAPEYMLTAAERFCQRANAISDGIFSIAFVKSNNPVADFKTGSADMILTDGRSAENLHSFFAVMNEPFRYGGYERFAIACNSAPILERLSEAASVHVFGAYYTGSYVFFGQKPLDEFLKLSRDIELDSADDEGGDPKDDSVRQELRIFTSPGLGDRLIDIFPYITVTETDDVSRRVAALTNADILAETPLDEGLYRAGRPGGGDAWVITRSFHRTQPAWLLLKPSLYESLSPLGRAALSEAAAFMTGDIDKICLDRERELLENLENEGAEISDEFTSTRYAILRGENERNATAPDSEKEFRRLLSEYR